MAQTRGKSTLRKLIDERGIKEWRTRFGKRARLRADSRDHGIGAE